MAWLRTLRMVGREQEQAVLSSAVAEARADNPTVLVVEGEAGIGKTRLLSEAIERLMTDGDFLLIGHGVDMVGGELPFGVVSNALRDLVRRQGLERVRDTLAEDGSTLASLVPGLSREHGGPDRLRIFDAFATLLSRLSQESLTWLVIEDVHWADSTSRDLIGYLVRVVEHPAKLMVTLTLRTGEAANASLSRFMDEVARLPNARRLQLRPLSRVHVKESLTELLQETPSPALLDRVFQLSAGVPFFTEELVAGGLDSEGPVPESLAAMMRARVTSMSTPARRVVETAALSGGDIPHQLMEEVCNLSDGEVATGLEEAMGNGVLDIDRTGLGYRFHHALMREAVAAAIAPGDRIRGHRRWAVALEKSADRHGDPLVTIATAHHWAAAGDRERAFTAAFRAADSAAAVGAEGERANLLTTVLELWPAVPDGVRTGMDRDDVLEDVITARLRADQPAEAVALIDVELQTDGPDDEVRRYHLRLTRARHANRLGLNRDPIVRDQVASGAFLRDAPDSRVFVRAVANFFEVGLGKEVALARDDLVHRAMAVADRLGRPLDRLAIRHALIEHLGDMGEFDQAVVMSIELLPWVRQNFTITEICEWESSTAWWLCCTGRYDEAVQLGKATLQRLENPLLAPSVWTFCVEQLAYALTELAAWDEAQELLPTARNLGTRGPGSVVMDATAGMIHVHRGQLDDAAKCLAIAEGRIPDAAQTMPTAHLWGRWLAAELSLAQGEPAVAREIVTPILSATGFRASGELWRLVLLAARAEVQETGHPSPSRRHDAPSSHRAADLLRLSQDLTLSGPLGIAVNSQLGAQLARLEGNDGAATWRAVADTWRATGQVHDQGWALLRLGECLLADRDKPAARTAMTEALAIGTKLAAPPLVDAVHEMAGRGALSLTPPQGSLYQRRSISSYGLTARESEVLRVLAQGHSNDQIAEELFISPKTASVHVSRILTKLGVSSRAQATALAYRQGLLDS